LHQLLSAVIFASAALYAINAFATPIYCVREVYAHGPIAEKDGKWEELTHEQWQFLRGIYAMNPETPPGLPYGDRAVLAQVAGDTGGLVFFMDGDLACTPMAIPVELLAMLNAIKDGRIDHELPPT